MYTWLSLCVCVRIHTYLCSGWYSCAAYSLQLSESLDLRVHLSSGVLKAGGSITAQCQSASGRNLSLAAEVTINGIPVTEKDGYRLELTNRDSSGVAVCEAVQQGNNSIDLNETASAPFTAVGEGPSVHMLVPRRLHDRHFRSG